MALLIDGLIVVFYFAAIIAIGLYMGRREGSLRDFALGGRQIPWWAVMASIIAAEVSAATFLGTPVEGFSSRNFAFVQLVAGVILGRILVGYIFLRPYFAYKVYTVYDYLDIRFGPVSRNYVSALFLVMRTLASGTRLFVPALVMVLAWRLLMSGSQARFDQQSVTTVGPYLAAILLLTVLTCIYATAGGIKAVIWTDLIQASLMFGSGLIAIGTLLHHVGGFHSVATAVPELTTISGYFRTGLESAKGAALWDKIKLVVSSDYTLFSALIANTLTTMAYFGTDQDMVQRMLSAQSYRKGRRSLITSALTDVPIAAMFTFIGILLFVFYQQNPSYRPAADADIFGSYILNVMPIGLRGLLLAGIFATSMGSLSAALNALATSATNDWYIPRFARHKSESHHVAAARVFTAVFALLMIGIATLFAYLKVHNPQLRIIPVVLGIANFIIGPMLGVFLIGMFTQKRGSDAGNAIAITVGLITTIYVGGLHRIAAQLLGYPDLFSEPPIKVSFTWFALIGAMVVVLVGIGFPTPADVLERAARRAEQAATDDRPIALRD